MKTIEVIQAASSVITILMAVCVVPMTKLFMRYMDSRFESVKDSIEEVSDRLDDHINYHLER